MSTAPAAKAAQRAARLYPRSPHFRRAYVRGALAGLAGVTAEGCPYKPERGSTWRTSWRRAWLRGHASAYADE